MKILFLCKNRVDNYGYCVGLINSSYFISRYLKECNVETLVKQTIDGNDVDRQVVSYNPDMVIIEALWITPDKFRELFKIRSHQKRKWVVRIHSKVPFLSSEGIAIDWIKQYAELGITIAPNSKELVHHLSQINVSSTLLPNIYHPLPPSRDEIRRISRNAQKAESSAQRQISTCARVTPFRGQGVAVEIGCFGAIRPFKNHLSQAFAAIKFGNKIGKPIRFHINGHRIEQNGENALKNLKALFDGTPHQLILHRWLPHAEFLALVAQMDIGMQVSFTESFNVVTADFVYQGVPILVSEDVEWMPGLSKVKAVSYYQIANGLLKLYRFPSLYRWLNKRALANYNGKAKKVWRGFLSAKDSVPAGLPLRSLGTLRELGASYARVPIRKGERVTPRGHEL